MDSEVPRDVFGNAIEIDDDGSSASTQSESDVIASGADAISKKTSTFWRK